MGDDKKQIVKDDSKSGNGEELKKLLEKNIKLSEEILLLTTKTRKYIFWQQVYGVLKILIFVVPIVIGVIYLPQLLRDLFEQYGGLLGFGKGIEQVSPELLKQIPESVLNQLPSELIEQIKSQL